MLWALLMATLAGAASARPKPAPLGSSARSLTVAAADCYPVRDYIQYLNGGWVLGGSAGTVSFICPVHFPDGDTYVVQSITMYAYDDKAGSGGDDKVCAEANRLDLTVADPDDIETRMGKVCSTGDNEDDPRSFSISGAQINPNQVDPTHGMYLWVTMGSIRLRLYGFHISYDLAASIDIEKHTNGMDADQAPGPLILEGDPVTWTYEVKNTGSGALSSVAVTDDKLGTICSLGTLAAGESDTCTANGTAVAGQYENVGTVVGTPSEGPTVSDQDASHYFGADQILPTYLPLATRNY